MLTSLSVRHLAIVEDVELHFTAGMTSLTGETGAGKSILVDALGLVLGDRADSKMIRNGYDRAEIEASFSTDNNPRLNNWLIDNQLDDEGHCNLRRIISSDGRSQGYINSRKVSMSLLRAISERTIDIHGQHAHQSLLRNETQRQLLDVAAKTQPLLELLATAFHDWQRLQSEIDIIQNRSADQKARYELLQYQINELESYDLREEHISSLLKEQQQLAHASQLLSTVESSIEMLFEAEHTAAYDLINTALSRLEKLHNIEPKFTNIIETLTSSIVQLDECAGELRHYIDSTDLDPQRLNEIETELSALHSLARKHHIEIEQLPQHYLSLCQQLSMLNNIDNQTEQLQAALKQQEITCRQLCDDIHQKRIKASTRLAKEITHTIQNLAIAAGRVEFIIKPMPNNRFNETGADSIQLWVSTNPGQQTGELAKVASGGELARISLAIQVVTAGTRSVPTLVFDEVDVGIGGSVAEIVGQHLRQLASTQQVICITHLPQVAAQAHQQLHVYKKQDKANTYINVSQLNIQQRIEEIARMLGGVILTEKTRSHAQEMLEQAQI